MKKRESKALDKKKQKTDKVKKNTEDKQKKKEPSLTPSKSHPM
jgi:hypothetical protein